MIQITNTQKISWFDYLYMLVMVIYLGQATTETAAMVNTNILKNFIGFIIPFFLSIIFVIKHHVRFNSLRLKYLITIFSFWCLGAVLKYGFGIIGNYSIITSFYLFYAILVAYIHVIVFRESLFPLYEHVIYIISFISIILWCFAVLMPGIATPFFRSLPLADYSHYGNHFLYLFTWMDPAKGQVANGLIRNAGCAWEPGRFAVMICFAICLQYLRQGIKVKGNNKLFILVLALILTQSTTGYFIFFLITFFFVLKLNSVWSFIAFLLLLILVYILISSIDFLGEKIQMQTDFSNVFFDLENRIAQTENLYGKGEYSFSLERFPAMYFELQNVIHDPILGYTQMREKSFFYNEISTNCSLTGGLVKVIGWFGLFLGSYLYVILYKSTMAISKTYRCSKYHGWALFLTFLFSSISYTIFTMPIFTAIWFWGYFNNNKN